MKENEIEETERKKVSPPFSFSIGPPTDYDSTRIFTVRGGNVALHYDSKLFPVDVRDRRQINFWSLSRLKIAWQSIPAV